MINTQVNVFSDTTSFQTVTQTEYIISTMNISTGNRHQNSQKNNFIITTFEFSQQKMIFLLVTIWLFLISRIMWQAYAGTDCFEHPPPPTPTKNPYFVNQDTKNTCKFFYPKNKGMENFQPPKGFEQIVCYGPRVKWSFSLWSVNLQ